VADDAGAFVDACRSLYGSPAAWARVAASGFGALRQHASVPAVVTATADLLAALLAAPPTTMASAAAAATATTSAGSHFREEFKAMGAGEKGHSAFSRRVDFGRRALAMKGCTDAHTADLLTFSPVAPVVKV
jgi:hypothetical protein